MLRTKRAVTWLQCASGHFGEQAVKLAVLLVDTCGIWAVVILFSSKQCEVPRPAQNTETRGLGMFWNFWTNSEISSPHSAVCSRDRTQRAASPHCACHTTTTTTSSYWDHCESTNIYSSHKSHNLIHIFCSKMSLNRKRVPKHLRNRGVSLHYSYCVYK